MTSKSKTLARHGSLDQYVDSLPTYEDETINSALEARKVEIGSKWTPLNEFHTAISNDILASGEVEVYKLRHDGFVVTVTVIYGEGETSEFELYLFVNLFKRKPVIDDTFNDDTPAQTFGDIQWDIGTDEKCEAITAALCPDCGRTVPADSLGALFMTSSSGVCNYCSAKYSREKINAGKMRLVGIAGPARAGKDTLASYLIKNLGDGWTRSSFADPLKDMLRVIGVDCSDEAKDLPSNQYGLSTRHMLQTLGTEWGRDRNGNNFWIDVFARSNAGKCVIVPDVRFDNEAELVRANGVLIHLVGRGGIEGNHVSENAIELKAGDIVIDNSRDLAWLHGQVNGNAVLGEFVSAE